MKLFLATVLAFICALLFLLQFCGIPRPMTLAADVQTQHCARLRFVYDVPPNAGLPEPVVRMIDSRNTFQNVRFPINATTEHNLRILVDPGGGKVRLGSVRLERFGGSPIEASNLMPLKEAVKSGDGSVTISATTAGAGVSVQLSNSARATRSARFLRAGILATLSLLCAVVAWLAGRWFSSPASASPQVDRVFGRAFIAIIVISFLLASALKLHGSATPLWRYYADRSVPRAGVWLGQPKDIRSDEWMVQTPWIMSQAARGFPLLNPLVGDGAMTLLNNLPARHWSMLLRPQMWGFFVADFEHAFALYWNFKWLALLLGSFLLLRALCHGQSVVAALGALLLYFSAFIQWWFSTPTSLPEMLGALFFALWALTLIAHSSSKWTIVAAAIVFVAATAQIVFCSYPRFAVPLIWLALFLVAGGVAKLDRDLRTWRIAALAGALIVTTFLLVCWFHQLAHLIRQIADLVYPGHIISTGGGAPWRNFTAPFLEFSMTQEYFRKDEMNVCNASGFLFFAPFLAAACLRDAWQKRYDPVLLALVLYSVCVIVFMHFGVPLPIAQWSGFSRVYSVLANLGVGVAGVLGLCRVLSRSEPAASNKRAELTSFVLLAALLFTVLAVTNELVGHFVTLQNVIAAAVFFALVFVSLWMRRVALSAILLLVPLIYTNGLVNPIVRGLTGVTGSELFQEIAQINRAHPGGKWIVLGQSDRAGRIAHLAGGTGADVLGATRCNPDTATMRILDPAARYAEIYNRHAAVSFAPADTGTPVFQLTFADSYRVLLPLATDLFDRLDIAKVMEVDLARHDIADFDAVSERNDIRVLLRQSHRPQ